MHWFYTINSTSCTSLFILFLKLKNEGLISRVYRNSHWRCSGKNVFLEIVVVVFKSNCKGPVNPWSKSWKNKFEEVQFY